MSAALAAPAYRLDQEPNRSGAEGGRLWQDTVYGGEGAGIYPLEVLPMQREWSVRLTEFDLSALRDGKHVEKNLQVGVLVVTQDPEGGLHLTFLPESRG